MLTNISRSNYIFNIQLLAFKMSMKKTPNQSSGPRFIKENVQNKSKSEHNQSFDASYNKSISYAPTFSNHSRMKSYSQQQNILDELEEDSYPKTINVTVSKRPCELKLQEDLQRILKKCVAGQPLTPDDFTLIINTVEECIQESLFSLKQKDYEMQMLRSTFEQQLNQQQNMIVALENENLELRQMIDLHPNEGFSLKLQQLEQENEMLKIQNQQAIKLAVQGRTKKQEKELFENFNRIKTASNTKPQVNNYSILLNQQYNKIYPQDRKQQKSQLF